jgi:Cu(I)/Ag(I) efflux system membrane protein CusA/SilA
VLERLIAFSIRNRFFVLALTALVSAFGLYSLGRTPIDAIPDLSENQVIVFTDWMGRSPKEIEDQVTYPLSVNLQGLAGVKTVRSSSEFNFSMIDVIFEDGVDFYFARNRVLERLSIASTFLPQGVVPYLAPDATALGQVFWYTVDGQGYDLGQLRAIQDWYVRYQLNAVPGVAQCASVGGYVKEYQVDVNPSRLRAYGITLGQVFDAVARSNAAVGGQVFHENGAEYLIRAVGWVKSLADIEETVVASHEGTPIRLKDVAVIQLGPQPRRAVLERDGREAVGGVVLMRYGENPLGVTKRVKERIAQLAPGLPPGVRIVPFYDRTRLIESAVSTLVRTLLEEMLIASLAVLLILGHARSAFVICLSLPIAVLVSFVFMHALSIPSNIMSLSGIAISIGVLVDAAIVMVENATTTLHARFGKTRVHGDTRELLIQACQVVGRPLFFSVLIIIVSFLPVFALGGTEGKMFRPLAFTKTFALVGVAIFAVTVVPALLPTFLRGRMRSDDDSFVVRSVKDVYRPVLTWLLHKPQLCLWFLFLLVMIGATLWPKLGREFMPPLDEGAIVDMPITIPRVSVTQAGDDLRLRDAVLRGFPEVESVVGKAGRAETPTDPAPPSMVETVVNLIPRDRWPRRSVAFADAESVAAQALDALAATGAVKLPAPREDLENRVTMAGLETFDRATRAHLVLRANEHGPRLATSLAVGLVTDLLESFWKRDLLLRPSNEPEIAEIASGVAAAHGPWFATSSPLEEITSAENEIAEALIQRGVVPRREDLLALPEAGSLWREVKETLGAEHDTFEKFLAHRMDARRDDLASEEAGLRDAELRDRSPGDLAWAMLDAARAVARDTGALAREPADEELRAARATIEKTLAGRLLLWHRTKDELVREMDTTLAVPGWGNIWTQPIVNRIDMLSTGVRSMIGVKVYGDDLGKIQEVSAEIARVLKKIPGAVDVFPDQVVGESYLEVRIDRAKASRYGVNVGDVNDVVEVALGGKAITYTVEGRARFAIRVRYARDSRQSLETIKKILVSGIGGPQVPLEDVASVEVVEGPSMIKSENGLLRSYVQLNVRDRDIVGFVEEAERAVKTGVTLPRGFFVEWSGEFEAQLRAKRTLRLVFPLVILLIFLVLYLTYHDLFDTLLMFLSVPGAVAGAVIFQYFWGINFSVAVWVGYIACFGLATETGIIMLIYLREAIAKRGGLAAIASEHGVDEAVLEGAVHRLRPKLLTEAVIVLGLVPMLWAHGTGAEIMRPMAVPVLGGILIADEVIDIFIPVFYAWWQRRRWRALQAG